MDRSRTAARADLWTAAKSACSSQWGNDEPNLMSTIGSAVLIPKRSPLAGIFLTLVDAVEAGLWTMYPIGKVMLLVPRPSLFAEGTRLHRKGGPAVSWESGSRYYFWRGVHVSEDAIMRPEAINVMDIETTRNAEERRVLIELYGFARYLKDGNFQKVQQDDFGTLYRKQVRWKPDMVFVHVVNSTPEPDGTYKEYVLPVSSACKTAHEAVASSFGLTQKEYFPCVES